MNKTIENLKKLKSFHNGSYGADIDKAIKTLEQEPCEDCISRHVVLNEIPKLWNSRGDKDYCMESLRDFVSELPPVIPQPKTGQWVNGEYCSECGCDVPTFIIDWRWQEEKDMDAKYCPNCGAKMKGKSEEA